MNAPLSPEKIEELKKLKASLGSFQDPDTGTAGRRFPILSEGLVENLVPGVSGRFNLFTHSQQAALESYEAKRLDDGVSGEHRIARVVYYEEKSLQDAEYSNVIAELIAMQPEDEPVSAIGNVRIVYCATAGGATSMNIVPDNVMGDGADLTRIHRYPKFYSLTGDGETEQPEPILGGLCYVEYRDLEEYSFGIYRGMVGETDESGLGGGRSADSNTGDQGNTNSASSNFTPGIPPSLNINRGDYPNANAHRRARQKAAGDYMVSEDIIRANPPSNSSDKFIGIAGMNNAGFRKKSLFHECVESDFDKKSGVSEAQFFGMGKSKRYKGHGLGNVRRVHLRRDAMEYLKKAVKEIHARGGVFVSAGGCPGIKRSKGSLVADQHRLGTAFDFSIGCATDRRGFVKTGGASKGTPRYIHVRIGPHSRRHKLMCRVDDDHPAASQTPVGTHLHQVVRWSTRTRPGSLKVVQVTGRYFDLSELMARYGFTSIGGYRSFYYRGGKDQGGYALGHTVTFPRAAEHEWWHYQFCSQFIYGKTNYLSELTKSYTYESISKNYDRNGWAKISRKQGWIYGQKWG